MNQELEINNARKVIKANKSCFDHSSFTQSGMMNLYLEDVSLVGTKISNANLSNLTISNAQMGGATFYDIGVPQEGDQHYNPETAGKQVKFENCDLKGTLFSNCDLANVEIANCNVSGMKINGIDVKDLFNAYSKAVGNENG